MESVPSARTAFISVRQIMQVIRPVGSDVFTELASIRSALSDLKTLAHECDSPSSTNPSPTIAKLIYDCCGFYDTKVNRKINGLDLAQRDLDKGVPFSGWNRSNKLRQSRDLVGHFRSFNYTLLSIITMLAV